MPRSPPTLLGSLVSLEPLSEAHIGALVAAASESRESYSLAHVPDGPAAMGNWVARAIAARQEGRQLPFVIRELASERTVGSTRFHKMTPWVWPRGSSRQRSGAPDAVEIGYTWLADSAQRSGINVDAKLALMTHAFETWEVHRVRFRTDERNVRSRRAIEALGAAFDGVLRADRPGADDVVRNSAYYSILASEWPEIKVRLEARLRRHSTSAAHSSPVSAIRTAVETDLVDVLKLWERSDAEPTHTDDLAGLRHLMEHDPGALLVAEDETLVGSIITGWDGWRGSIYRLVVDPAHRRGGLGTSLLAAAEARLKAVGARRIQAIVVDTDPQAMAFWRSASWEPQAARQRFVRG